jgi:hypothetical protein
MTSTRTQRVRRSAAQAVVAILLTAGCAGSTPPGEAVPELRSTLAQVDRAIVEQKYAQARTHLKDLVQTTTTARDDGELESAEAEPILAAAENLLTALPQPSPRTDGSTQSRQPEHGSDDDQEKQRDELDKKREELEKKRDELEKKREEEAKKESEKAEKDEKEGGGNGESENGPDDGEGN